MTLKIETKEAPTVAAEELAELEARGRKGIPELPDGWGEVNEPEAPAERTVDVTAYGPDGESIVVTQAIPFYEVKDGEVVDPPRAAGDWSAAPKQTVMPGFDGVTAEKVVLTFSGNVTLDMHDPAHKAIWDALRWQSMARFDITATCTGKFFKGETTGRAMASLSVWRVAQPTDARNPYDDSTEDDDGNGPECEECGLRAATATGEDGERLCDQCAAQPSDSQPEPAATGSELDQALAEALAVVGEDDDSPTNDAA